MKQNFHYSHSLSAHLSCALFLLMALMPSSKVMGQTLVKQLPADDIEMSPKQFSYQGKSYLYVWAENDKVAIYDENLDEVKRFWLTTTSENERVEYVYLHDSEYFADDESFTLSQTLFNNDEKFEYIVLRRDGNDWGSPMLGFDIRSEDGTTLSSINLYKENGDCGFDIYKMGNKVYLGVEFYGDNREVYLYSINRETSSLQQVKSISGLNIKPRMPRRNEVVTVEMDEVSNEARELQVVNSAGQTVERIVVPAGSKQVQLKASRMSPGVNVIQMGHTDGYKIYVK